MGYIADLLEFVVDEFFDYGGFADALIDQHDDLDLGPAAVSACGSAHINFKYLLLFL